jgi:uncharacterized membrane protein
MFAGHIGVALAAARIEPRVNVGMFAAASLLLDLFLWLFILVGWESVAIPADFPQTHQPQFVFPYSHGLLASFVWSTLAGALMFLLPKIRAGEKSRSAILVAGVVLSHWLLDALVHRPELPVTGAASHLVGLGLWNDMPVALLVEAALVLVGTLLFLLSRGLSRPKKLALAALNLLVLAFTVAGMTVAPPPPSAAAMAGSSLATIVLVCVLIGWLGSGARERQA